MLSFAERFVIVSQFLRIWMILIAGLSSSYTRKSIFTTEEIFKVSKIKCMLLKIMRNIVLSLLLNLG